jgi:cytochrome c-type biogenesis protein CcmH
MRILLVVTALLFAAGLQAKPEVLDFDSEAQEATYKELTEELRCTVCQNQNIADSNAELAADLRRKTYNMVREGKSKAEIKDYMVQRYGNFVLYKPPVTAGTLLLWIGPFLFLLFGGWLLLRFIQRHRQARRPNDIDEAQLRRAAALLRGDEDTKA